MITDDDLHKIMVAPLPQGCRFIAIFDSCHSGTVLDLPYTYNPDGTLKKGDSYKDLGKRVMKKKGLMSMGMELLSGAQTAMNSDSANERAKQTKTTRCHAIMLRFGKFLIVISGSEDSQTSADAHIGGQATVVFFIMYREPCLTL
jgi:hypothetical protein